MKIRLTDLEHVRSNPKAYRDILADSTENKRFFRMSRRRALHLSIYEYHRRGESVNLALIYLEDLYHRRFKNEKYLTELEDQVEDYASEFRRHGNSVVEFKTNVSINIESGLQITGEIPRLDLVPQGGYEVLLFPTSTDNWTQELRYPLLQAHFSKKLGAPVEEMSVGIYDVDRARYETTRFTTDEIAAAHEELREIAAVLGTGGLFP